MEEKQGHLDGGKHSKPEVSNFEEKAAAALDHFGEAVNSIISGARSIIKGAAAIGALKKDITKTEPSDGSDQSTGV